MNHKELEELKQLIFEIRNQIKDLKKYIEKEIINKKKDPKIKIDWIDLTDWEEDEDLKDE